MDLLHFGARGLTDFHRSVSGGVSLNVVPFLLRLFGCECVLLLVCALPLDPAQTAYLPTFCGTGDEGDANGISEDEDNDGLSNEKLKSCSR